MRKKHPEHVNLERWLVSYADFMTLLFALFVILYASARADKAKASAVAASMRKAFGAGPVGMVSLGGASGGQTANPFEMEESPGGRVHDMPAGKTNTASDPDPELQEIKELLEEEISLQLGTADVTEKLQMQFDSRGLIVRISTKDFFEEGVAVPRTDLTPVLDRIGRVLSHTKRLVRIEGHADSAESNPKDFRSAWELSSARAESVAQYWINKFGLEPSRVGVAGYSYYRPVTQDTDPWQRAKNRRVEVIILNNLYEAP